MEDFHKRNTLPGVKTAKGAPESHPLPTQIGPYKIEGMLSRGGMSCLYLGLHPETHDPIAIKVLLPKYVSHPEMTTRFLREAEVISLADHPNIVKLYGQGEWEGGLYIAMEFIQGISLRQFILQHTMSLKRGLETILQIASALEHLHSHGVIHRDLKPENVLITSKGGIKVIDFGIAQLHQEDKPTGMMGTPIYMSPEQRKDPRTVTAASDIFSLALVAYELVLGRLSHGVVHVALLPKGLQPILAKALNPDPAGRYSDVHSFSRELTAYLESEAIERDQRGRGYAQDLAEHVRRAQETLLPRRLPQWPKVEVGVAVHRELTLAGLYYDFLQPESGRYGLVLSEPSATGVEGILHMALLQGIVHSLADQYPDPAELIRRTNALVVAHAFEEIFTLNYLMLDVGAGLFQYLSCGYGPLWLIRSANRKVELIPSQNLALGIDLDTSFAATTQNWHVGDTIVLTTLRAAIKGAPMTDLLQEQLYASPQKQAEALLRRVVQTMPAEPTRRPLAVISVRRIA